MKQSAQSYGARSRTPRRYPQQQQASGSSSSAPATSQISLRPGGKTHTEFELRHANGYTIENTDLLTAIAQKRAERDVIVSAFGVRHSPQRGNEMLMRYDSHLSRDLIVSISG